MLREFLFKLDIIAPVIFMLFFLLRRNKTRSFADRIILLFIFLQIFFNVTAATMQAHSLNNLWIYHLNCFVTHALFTFYFLKFLNKRKIIYCGIGVFVLVYIILLTKPESFISFPSYSYAVASGILAIYASVLLNQVIDFPPVPDVLSLKDFWIITAILTYFGSSFVIFMSYDYLSSLLGSRVAILWQFHNTFFAIGCGILFKGSTATKWIQK